MAINATLSGIKCGFLNVQSVGNKTFDIHDLITVNDYDILAVAETWLHEYDTAKIREMTPETHSFLHAPRKNRRGGGVGIFLSNSFRKIKIVDAENIDSFEHIQISCEAKGEKIIFIVAYRPPHMSANVFIEDFRMYLETVDTVSANVFICGDFNLWVDDPDAASAKEFIEMMDTLNFVNNVTKATSVSGHILDLVFSDKEHNLVQEVLVDDICRISPVHMLVTFIIPYMKEKKSKKNYFI